MPRLLTVWILLTVWALPVGSASAQSDSRPECLTEAVFRQAVLEALGEEARRVPAGYRLRATPAPGEGGLRAVVRLTDREGRALGTRAIEARDCPELIEAAGLVGALALTNLPPLSSRAVPTSDPSPPSPTPPLPPETGSNQSRSVLVAAVVNAGGGPGIGGGLVGEVTFLFPRISLGLGLLADLPSRGPVQGGALGVERFTLRANACLRARALSFCAVLHEGALRIRGLVLVDARSVTRHFTSAGPELGLDLEVTRGVSLRASLGAQIPVWRYEVRDDSSSATLWSMPPALVDAGLGLVLEMP